MSVDMTLLSKDRMNRKSITVHPIGHTSPVGDFAWACFAAKEARRFADLQGNTFGGSYAEASDWMACQLPLARAFVVLFARGDGMEEFFGSLSSDVVSVPMAGGAAEPKDICIQGGGDAQFIKTNVSIDGSKLVLTHPENKSPCMFAWDGARIHNPI